eukprot:3729597-Prymnesium_polylepis.1
MAAIVGVPDTSVSLIIRSSHQIYIAVPAYNLPISRCACAVHVARRPARACGKTLVQVSARRPRRAGCWAGWYADAAG